MKLIHLSDLHLGKRVNEFSMLEDQAYILEEILKIIDRQQPQAVLIAGDVYDKPTPSGEAVQLFDDFLCKLGERKLQVFVISGNHDSAERMAFGGRLMNQSGIHMSPVYDGKVEPISLEDEWGPLHFYMLPFLKPAHVRRFFQEEAIDSYTDALRVAIEQMEMNGEERNVLITHQFVTGALRTESEEISVGGSDNVDALVFEGFDYVALGHLHRPQNVGTSSNVEGNRIRYCGTPLKYSFSESRDEKSVTIVEMGKKGDVVVRTVGLQPLREMREIKGSYMELTARSNYEGTRTDDYIHVTLTDEEDVPDAIGRLRVIYPNLMKLDYDNLRTRGNLEIGQAEDVERKTPLELFSELYEKQNNQSMSREQELFMEDLIERIWEGER